MSSYSPLETATAANKEVPQDWMPAGQVRPFIFEDPVTVWLRFHGKHYGFEPDSSPYEFLEFIGQKGREFEDKWIQEMTPEAVSVCEEAYEVRAVDKVRETWDLMLTGTPVIAQPALWWAPDRVYGVPDLIIHTSWLTDNFPELLSEAERLAVAPNLKQSNIPGHYIVFDNKFTSNLDGSQKVKDLKNYAAQMRIYSYILGQFQGLMPQKAFLITRDRISSPLSVNTSSTLNQPIDADLAAIRDKFVDIKLNGANYLPWQDSLVASNIKHQDDKWKTAKGIIAREKFPGKDPSLLYQISLGIKAQLSSLGFPSLDSLVSVDAKSIPFEQCRGLGPAKSKRIRAILQSNRSGSPVLAPSGSIPVKKPYELYVDFEYFSNVNVDFDKQWPDLEGCEMIFMIGVGWDDDGSWSFETFVADAEDHNSEYEMFEKFADFLQAHTVLNLADPSETSLYHWSSAEVWQTRRASDRHNLADDHPLRKLPWYDLQKVFLNGPCAVPNALSFGLKEVANALGRIDPRFKPEWPGDLDEGLRAMVMGWKAYETSHPLESQEMATLKEYLEADCQALWKVLKWLRS